LIGAAKVLNDSPHRGARRSRRDYFGAYEARQLGRDVHIFACHEENLCSTPVRRRILITTAMGITSVLAVSFIPIALNFCPLAVSE
jgi:hypothetical protein